MNEEWRPIVNYEGLYEVSNFGKIINARSGYNFTQCINNRGYLFVGLHKNGKRMSLTSHRIIASAFLGLSLLEVNHKDGNKTNNHINNLEYVSARENSNHTSVGKYMKGVQKAKMKFSSTISIEGKRKYLGNFPTELEAHQAYVRECESLKESKYISGGTK